MCTEKIFVGSIGNDRPGRMLCSSNYETRSVVSKRRHSGIQAFNSFPIRQRNSEESPIPLCPIWKVNCGRGSLPDKAKRPQGCREPESLRASLVGEHVRPTVSRLSGERCSSCATCWSPPSALCFLRLVYIASGCYLD